MLRRWLACARAYRAYLKTPKGWHDFADYAGALAIVSLVIAALQWLACVWLQ